MNDERIDVRDLALMLGPGSHNLNGYTLFICDGTGRELEVLIESGSIDVLDESNFNLKETP